MMQDENGRKYIYVAYDEWVSGGNDTYGEDGPYTGYNEEDWEFNLKGAYLEPPTGRTTDWDQVELIGGKADTKFVYVLYARYSTGGTFGHESGRGHIINAYASKEDALKDKGLIEEDDRFLSENRWRNPKACQTKKWVGDAPWIGYFERLESVEMQIMEIEQ